MNLVNGLRCPHCYKLIEVIADLASEVFISMTEDEFLTYITDWEAVTK